MLRKSSSLAFLLGVVVAACTPDRPSPPPPAAPSPSTTVAASNAVSIDPRLLTLRSLYAASGSDPAAAGRFYADDASKRFGDLSELHGRAAIEASVRDEIAKLGKPTYAPSRVWIKADTVIAEEVVNATVGGRAIGVPALNIYWFDPAGLIRMHHAYRNDGDIDGQIKGDPEASPVVAAPTSLSTYVAQDSSDESSGAALLGRFDAAFAKGPEAVEPILADDVRVDCTMGAHSTGKAKYLEEMGEFMQHFPGESYTIEHVWSVEDFIIAEHTMHATRKKTGKPIVMPAGEVFHIVDSKIAGDWAFIDPRSFQKP